VGAFGKSFLYLTLCFLLNGLVMGLVGLPFKFSGELSILGFWPASEWYFYSAFVYHNHWGAYALLCLAAASAVGFGTCLDRPRCLLAVIFAGGLLLGTTLVATARLATLMQVMFVFSVLVSLARLHPSLLSRRLLPLIFLCGALVVGGAVILMKQGGAASGGHRTWAKLLSQNPFTSRLHLVEDTLPMIAAKPLFGWGLGAYRSGFRLYQRPETRVVHNQGRITLYNHAHNDWIQTLAELGVVGCFLLLTPFGYYLFRARFGMNLPEFQRWLVFGCLVLLLMAWGESLFLNRSVAAAFFILLGLALHPTTRKPRDCIDKGNPEG
jgi:O-antigen ligase